MVPFTTSESSHINPFCITLYISLFTLHYLKICNFVPFKCVLPCESSRSRIHSYNQYLNIKSERIKVSLPAYPASSSSSSRIHSPFLAVSCGGFSHSKTLRKAPLPAFGAQNLHICWMSDPEMCLKGGKKRRKNFPQLVSEC